MAPFLKALGITFGIYVLYALILTLIVPDGAGMAIAFFVSLVHGLVSLIIGIVFAASGKEKQMLGLGLIVGALLVVMVGLAGCMVSLNQIY